MAMTMQERGRFQLEHVEGGVVVSGEGWDLTLYRHEIAAMVPGDCIIVDRARFERLRRNCLDASPLQPGDLDPLP